MRGTIIPMLTYERGTEAMDWLCRVFGFTEKTKWLDEQGRLTHGEIVMNDGMIMLAGGNSDYQSPAHHRQTCAQSAKWLSVPYIINGVLVYVKDIEAHYQQSVRMGAGILSGLEYGDPGNRYRAEDPEGHRWMFLQAE